MTAEEFLALPAPEHPQRRELVDGEVVVSEPRPLHQRVLMDLAFALESWTRADPARGEATLPLDVKLDDRNVYAPDLLFYAGDRGPGRSEVVPSPLPDLAVEVRSPSTWRYDVGVKKAVYERLGLRELWLVDTAADEVLVFRRSGPAAAGFDVALELDRGGELSSPLLPGFGLTLAELFPRI
jgi:Uma2 family endonuclease